MSQNKGLITFLNVVSDALLIFAAYFAAIFYRFQILDAHTSMNLVSLSYLLIVILCSLAIVLTYAILQMYSSYRLIGSAREIYKVLLTNGIITLAAMSLLYLTRTMEFPRLVVILFWFFSCAFVLAKRLTIRVILHHYYKLGYNRRRLLLVGDSEMAQRYYQEIKNDKWNEYVLKGYLAPEENKEMDHYLGGYGELRFLLRNREADEVVIALQQPKTKEVGRMISICGRYGAKVSVIPAYNDYIPSVPTVEQIGNMKLFTVRSLPDKGFVHATVKRLMDIVGSLCGLILASPIMLVTAIAIKREDHGPAIFSQTRVGKNGREFKMYKFRSMYVGAEKDVHKLAAQNEASGPAFKMADDPRITKVGRFIRRTSIDELPQLVNILRGEMSLVGPRPPLPKEVAQYSDWDWGRLAVKPGLTCYWQISGRSNIDFDDWMKLDLRYVEEQGIWTDIKILWKTVWVVLRKEGAY